MRATRRDPLIAWFKHLRRFRFVEAPTPFDNTCPHLFTRQRAMNKYSFAVDTTDTATFVGQIRDLDDDRLARAARLASAHESSAVAGIVPDLQEFPQVRCFSLLQVGPCERQFITVRDCAKMAAKKL